MRKRIIGQVATPQTANAPENWLDLEDIAEVEVTSEAPGFPIEAALALEGKGEGWRAAESGEQRIRIVFDTPTAVRHMRLQFDEARLARTQEFVLRWAARRDQALQEILRQQWTFSPNGSTSEIENYEVNLTGAAVVELSIKPDISGGSTPASLTAWRFA